MRKETNVKNRILRHYDEEEKLEERRRKARARLDGRQELSAADLKEAEEAKKRLEALKGLRRGEKVTSLDDIKYSEVSDYYTSDEMASFKKKKKKKKKRRKKKTKMSLAEELEETQTERTKNMQEKKELPSVREKRKSLEKQRAYAMALERAREQSAAVSRQELGIDRQDVVSDTRSKKMSAAERIASKLALRKNDVKKKKKSSSDCLVFTSTTEFTQRLKSNINDRLEERIQKQKEERTETTKTTIEPASSTSSSSQDKDVAMTSEPLVGSSMAATLSLLNRTGELKDKKVIAGRAKDKLHDFNFSGDRIKLEYKDNFGRHLTPKEAYRQLSYKFHGVRPGRKKQEKILRKLKEDLQINAMKPGDTPLGMVRVMKQKQS